MNCWRIIRSRVPCLSHRMHLLGRRHTWHNIGRLSRKCVASLVLKLRILNEHGFKLRILRRHLILESIPQDLDPAPLFLIGMCLISEWLLQLLLFHLQGVDCLAHVSDLVVELYRVLYARGVLAAVVSVETRLLPVYVGHGVLFVARDISIDTVNALTWILRGYL